MKSVLLFIFLMAFGKGFAQADLIVDRDTVRIGDQVTARLNIPMTGNQQWLNEDHLWPDSLQGVEVIGDGIKKMESNRLVATYTIALFDSGRVEIPALGILLSGAPDTLWTQPVVVEVALTEPDSTGLQPIKDIVLQPFRPTYYLPYLLYGAGILVLGLLGWFLWKRRRGHLVEEVPTEIIYKSPYEWAMEELALLRQQGFLERGEVKLHYSRLTDILRAFLERQFHIRAMEQTTLEIQHQLKMHKFDKERVRDVGELLEIADLIKFAKADPGGQVHASAVDRIRDFIEEVAAPREPETPAEL